MRLLLLCFLCVLVYPTFAQDTFYLKVHFLYGSKPLKLYKNQEKKWFGGILGGHVGIESDHDKVLNFEPKGTFHWFPHKKNKHGTYSQYTTNQFYAYFKNNPDSAKKTIIYVPISSQQKQKFDSIAINYLKQTPYDYALFGMRCGAATYDILGQLNILPNYGYTKRLIKIIYPKKLRKRLLQKAMQNNWQITQHQGSTTRKWERD